jgi:hypothetical protein
MRISEEKNRKKRTKKSSRIICQIITIEQKTAAKGHQV